MNFDNPDGSDGYPYPPPRSQPTFRRAPGEPLRLGWPIIATVVVLITIYFMGV